MNEITSWHAASTKRLLRLGTVMILTGLSKSSIYNKIKEGTFPKQVGLSGGPRARAVGWRESDVNAWIDSCMPKA